MSGHAATTLFWNNPSTLRCGTSNSHTQGLGALRNAVEMMDLQVCYHNVGMELMDLLGDNEFTIGQPSSFNCDLWRSRNLIGMSLRIETLAVSRRPSLYLQSQPPWCSVLISDEPPAFEAALPCPPPPPHPATSRRSVRKQYPHPHQARDRHSFRPCSSHRAVLKCHIKWAGDAHLKS